MRVFSLGCALTEAGKEVKCLSAYGLNELLKREPEPYILVESFYGDQIAQILSKVGMNRGTDYEINCISPLLENIPEDKLEKVL